ncbi:NAD(P)/FAD-dependent oxidoreductase [Lacisediminimonas profundi]|uniref:NAD(P)/FAD-dependent oxidoreductase n=1 Tax=Lacisediminimonas profundi TaxID=2603856 RepID=UPI0013871EAA|nr:FAD-dependent oxidoreductase [Lacisediminimonas profundi]
MPDPESILIIGAGQAGGCAAATLRGEGYAGRIVLVGAEQHRPYERPPLSKSVLSDPESEPGIFLHKPEFHEGLKLEYLPGTRVSDLDPAGKVAHTADGGQIPWDRCLLATGGRVRLLPGVPEGMANVYYLRELDDARRLRERLVPGARVVVLGGGFLGLEFAAVAREKGLEVTVVEAGSQLLGRAAPALFADWLREQFAASGVKVLCNAGVKGIQPAGQGVAVQFADGGELAADFVLVSIGQVPNVELAQSCGLAIDNGIAVDPAGRTSAPDIFAAGDCASQDNRWLGRRVRLESWQMAQEQATVAARAMLGKPADCDLIPWFWSDQLGMNLQMLGVPEPGLQYEVRGAMDGGKFSIFGFDQVHRLRYVLAVNNGADMRPLRNLLEAGKQAPRDQLLDAGKPLREIVKQALAA